MTAISANFSQNETMDSDFQVISTPAVIYMRSQSSIIVLLNFIVLITLAKEKNKFPTVYWLQIVCLAFNDMLAGIANFLISFIDLPYIKDSLTNCSIVIVFLYSSQSASLYNIFGICIHRFIVLKRSGASSDIWKHRHTLLCTSFAWILSITLCSLPVALYKKPDDYNKTKFCSFQPLFGADVRNGMLILMGSFILPLIFTNALYITLFCLLKTVWKTVRPVRTATNSEVGSLCSMSALLNGEQNNSPSNRSAMITTISDQSVSSEKFPAKTDSTQLWTKRSLSQHRSQSFHHGKINSNQKMQNRQKSLFLKVPERQKTVKLLSVKPLCEPTPSTSSDQFLSTPNNAHNSKTSGWGITYLSMSNSRQNFPQTVIRQRKVYALLGIILLFLNMFTWPGVAALVLTSNVNTISLGRGTLLPLFTTICLNSAVNPILYTATIPEFRSALLNILLSITKWMKCSIWSFSFRRQHL